MISDSIAFYLQKNGYIAERDIPIYRLVGIVHSMIQMVASMVFGDEVALVVIGVLLTLTSYYSHFLLPSGYSMPKRSDTSSLDLTFEPLKYQIGLLYLGICIIIMYTAGLIYVKKKNIYWYNKNNKAVGICLRLLEFF